MEYTLHFGAYPKRLVHWNDVLVGSIEPMTGYDKWAFIPTMPPAYKVPAVLKVPIHGPTQRAIKSFIRRDRAIKLLNFPRHDI